MTTFLTDPSAREWTLAELDVLHNLIGMSAEWLASDARRDYLEPAAVVVRARADVARFITDKADQTCRDLGMDPWEVLHLPRHLARLEAVKEAGKTLRAAARAMSPDLATSGRLNAGTLA